MTSAPRSNDLGGSAGRAFVVGHDVDTDTIVPGRYLRGNADDAASHVMEGIRPSLAQEVSQGDVLVAGRNFGTGSSRELAVVALQRAGFVAVVALSFARIFFRNCINNGLLPLECANADIIEEGQQVIIYGEAGIIRIVETGAELTYTPFPAEIREIVDCGGLENYVALRGDL